MNSQTIKQLIESGLEDCRAIVHGDDGQHFTAVIISPAFTGKNRIQKQQLVYATLRDTIDNGALHAFSFKTLTPEEWVTQQNHE